MRDIEKVRQTDFFESFHMVEEDDSSENPELETSEVSSASVPESKEEDDDLDDAWLHEDFKPGKLQKEFAKIQPAGTLRVQRKVGKGEPDRILILEDRQKGDFTEEDEHWGSRIF